MRITKLSYFISLFFSTLCFSQNYSIQGLLHDESSQPIAFANAILVDLDDINIIKGTITDELGNFTLENLKPGDYILKISFLGFKEYTTRVELDRNIDFEIITLNETPEELKGVTVVAKRPVVKRLVDRIVFNVENSTLSNNNVLDVLKHTPGVIVGSNQITVKSKVPVVYINNRRIYLSIEEVKQLLESTPANNIKSIEVITNPPAKYEAVGGAVLNIITSKNIIAGYNGSVFGNYKQGSVFPKYSIGTSHFFKTKKTNTYINYNISPRKDFVNKDEFINFINDDDLVFSSWETNYNETKKKANQNINANIDYQINENNSIGFSTNILVKPRDNSKANTNSETLVFGANKVLDSTFSTLNRLAEESFNLAFTLDYLHKFTKEGEQISANLHHTNYDFSNFQDVNTGYFLPNADASFRDNRFQTFSSQKIKIYTSQIDYELPIDDSSLFEAGVKISNIDSESILNQFAFKNAVKTKDLKNSDTFLYDETIYAGYLSYAKDLKSWSLKSGLRVEYTNILGNSLSTNEISKNDYLKFFPSIYLSKKIKDGNELYFNYNKRIYRPSYAQLNPFRYFFNDNTFLSGDPNLVPQIDDQLTIGYLFKEDYNLEFYYRNESNPILLVVFQDNNNNLIKYANTNIDRSISYGIDFSVNKKLYNNWYISAASSLFYYDNQFTGFKDDDIVFTSSKWTSYMQFTNYFSFLKDKSLNIDLSYIYISPWAEGPSVVSTRSSLDLSIRKSFWDNKASLSIGVEDTFNGYNFTETSKYLNQDIVINSRKENRLFVIGFNYKFGNYRLSNSKKETNIEERNRITNKD
ncbi:outer membrane beta-barrel protein [Thalassobellus suaedae]|uniref:TonB-dependent receptor n=1 Tax=Thalassobellus suaedae TaxID=3074124 RepID=A0ABY9XWD0_9FLAO|nr:TonB-dependent receptor [Flavobacteriaceae bacterium HL-DH14]